MREVQRWHVGWSALCAGALAGALSLVASAYAEPDPPAANKSASRKDAPITKAEVNAAQQAWCDGLVKIGKVYEAGGDYKTAAKRLVDELYDYEEGKVFFKPTLAAHPQAFRNDKEGALAYFVGGNPRFPNDQGFALEPWTKVKYDNTGGDQGVQVYDDVALTMGNVYLTSKDGSEIKVDKTFAFKRAPDGKLKIVVHKSALPAEMPK